MTDNHPARTAPQQARTPADPTPDHDPSTARQLADDLIAGARRAEPVRHRGAYTLNATGFVLDSGGPRCDVTIVFDPPATSTTPSSTTPKADRGPSA